MDGMEEGENGRVGEREGKRGRKRKRQRERVCVCVLPRGFEKVVS